MTAFLETLASFVTSILGMVTDMASDLISDPVVSIFLFGIPLIGFAIGLLMKFLGKKGKKKK